MKYYYNQATNSFAVTTNFEYKTTPEGYVEISKERFEELQEELNQTESTENDEIPKVEYNENI